MLISKTVLQRKKNAKAVLAAIAVHGLMVAAKIEGRFAPRRREDLEPPRHATLLADLESELNLAYGTLEQADDAHLKEVANDRHYRRVRDDATVELQQKLLHHSRVIDASYGFGAGEETLGLGPGLRPIPDQIHDVGRRAADLLAQPDFTFGRPSLRGVDLDPEEIRSDIEGPLRKLGDALDALRREKRLFDETLRLKQEAISKFDETFTMVATWLKGMFLAAGEPLLAKRIRPTLPRPPRPGEEDPVVEVDPTTGEETPADPSGSSGDSGNAPEDKPSGDSADSSTSSPATPPAAAADGAADGPAGRSASDAG